MRFAFVVSSGLGYRIDNLFQTNESFREFETALKSLRENGFEGVELNLHFDDEQKLSRIRECVRKSGLKLACVGTGLIHLRDKLSFTNEDAKKRAKAVSIVNRLIKYAGEDRATVVIGSVRGATTPNFKSTMTHLRDSMVECDATAKSAGIRIALEPLNRYETAFLNNAEETVSFIESAKLQSTGILLDTFHMNIEEHSIEETLREHFSRIVHFHIADSNRWPPSYGHLKIADTLRLLQDCGYDAWVSAEVLPKPNNLEAVKATAEFLKSHRFMKR